MKNMYPDFSYLAKLARCAGATITENFVLNTACEWKGDNTPLTATDTAINAFVMEALTKDFPHIQFAGEEGDGTSQESEYVAILDPIDGTMCFTTGMPLSTFCISILKNEMPVAAVIYDPFQKRMWHAEKGMGAYENERKISVSKHYALPHSYIWIYWRNESILSLEAANRELKAVNAICVSMPSIAHFGGLVASGKIHGTITAERQIWEAPAMQLIIEEAGGRMTDINGNAMRYRIGVPLNGHITSNGFLHDKLLAIVNG